MERTVTRNMALVTLVLAVLVGPAVVHAQNSFGVTAGWNLTNWSGDHPFLELESKNGFAVGLFVEHPISKQLGVLGEMIYTRKGGKTSSIAVDEDNNELGEFDTFFNVDYVQIPVLFKYMLTAEEGTQPFLLAGAAYAFELSAKMEGDVPGSGEISEDLEDTAGWDLGAILGAGVAFEMGERNVSIDVRYEFGAEDVIESQKNTALSVMAALTF